MLLTRVLTPAEAPDALTEAGAATRFARLHGDDLRFDHRRGRWLLWRGHRWVPDADAAVTRRALDFVRAWQREAVDIPDLGRRDMVLRFALRLERRDGLGNLLALAKALKPIADAGADWDRDPWLLGVPNGVVDLRSGVLRPGRPDDRITMGAGVAFDPAAPCARWAQFIDELFGGDLEMVGFIQRAVGYSLCGETSEQALFLLYGTGANGKGTFSNTLAKVLGDYALNTPFSTLEHRDRTAIPNDLAALVNRRFVTASETSDGTRLNESRIKALTGGDSVTARFLHSEFFTFDPVAKFWLSVNHKPVVRDDSHGFWRRLRLIPFLRTFAVNPYLVSALQTEAAGILAWCVRGCAAWQVHRLQPPAAVTQATREYEVESDPLAAFLADACEVCPEAEVGASEFYAHYQRWAEQQRLGDRERMSATLFGRKMGERFEKGRDRDTGVIYKGIARRVKGLGQ